MKVKHLSLVDFRNYLELDFQPGPGANVLFGRNGAGKTNILEALHLAVTGFSYRAARDRDMVRHGCEAFGVRAAVDRDELAGDLLHQITFSGGRKTVKRGGKVLTGRARTDVLGAAVVFSPDDLTLVKGSPGARRDYLDTALAKADGRFRNLARRYQAALVQRNRLLSQPSDGPLARDLLDPWTEQLVELGARIVEYRLRGLAGLSPGVSQAYAALAGDHGETLTAAYVHGVEPEFAVWNTEQAPDRSAIEAHLRRSFAATARDERLRRFTLAGPHRDDLSLMLGDASARVFGSQGQQRSIALSLRLAETTFLQEVLGERPLLLLDDVFSELDETRRQALLALLSLNRTNYQTFVTATDLLGMPGHDSGTVATFRVAGGGVTCVPGS